MATYTVIRPLRMNGQLYGPSTAYSQLPSAGSTIELSEAIAEPLIESGTLLQERTMSSRPKPNTDTGGEFIFFGAIKLTTAVFKHLPKVTRAYF